MDYKTSQKTLEFCEEKWLKKYGKLFVGHGLNLLTGWQKDYQVKMTKCKDCFCNCHCNVKGHSDSTGVCPCEVCNCNPQGATVNNEECLSCQ